MVAYNSHWLTVRWDEALKASCIEAKAYAEGEEFRAGYRALLALIQRKRNSRHLGDTRAMPPVSQADQRWVNEELIPQMIAAGIRYIAVVMPKSAIARISVRSMINKINDISVVTNHFDSIEAARDWLRSV